MNDNWYCCYACFACAAADKFSELLAPGLGSSGHTSRMPLGLILISRDLMTHEQFKQAIEEQKETGTEIGELFVRLGYVTEKQMMAARSTQWGCPVFAAPNRPLPNRIHIPLTLMRLHSMVPLHYVAATNSLLIGFVHGIEYGALYAIEQMTGCTTRPCFVTPSDFQLQIHQYEHSEKIPPDELTFESVESPSKMAHVLCNYGGLLNADEVVVGRCGQYLWARLKNSEKTNDLLFRAA